MAENAGIVGAERPLRPLLLAGVLAPVLAWGLTVPVMLSWPGYDPVRQSISLLANAPNGWLQTLAFVISGGLGLAWAAGMGRMVGATAGDRRLVWRLLAFQAVVTILFAVFPTDPGARGTSPVGVLHLVDFAAYSISLPVTLLLVARVMGRDPRWVGWSGRTRATGWLVVAAMALVPVTLYGPLLPWLGLLERAYVAVPTAWELLVSVAALRRLNGQPARR
jgi:hypothetical membrane protein